MSPWPRQFACLLLVLSAVSPVAGQEVKTLTTAPIDASGGMSVGSDGSIYLANGGATAFDATGDEVYRISPAGAVSVFVDSLANPMGNAFDAAGNLYQVSRSRNLIYRITPDGGVSTWADSDAGLEGPVDLALDSQGNVYVANCLANNVLRITPGGERTVVLDDPNLVWCPAGVAIDAQDHVYVSNNHNTRVLRVSPQGEVSLFGDTGDWTPADSGNGGLVYLDGKLYLASSHIHRILVLEAGQDVKVFAGNGAAQNTDGARLSASLRSPWALDVSPDQRRLYVSTRDESSADSRRVPNRVRLIELDRAGAGDFRINTGLNDAWFDPATDGQGFFITVFADTGVMTLAWFTYETERPPETLEAVIGEPGHRWLTAVGLYEGRQAVLDITNATGGIFDSGSPAPEYAEVGTITLNFDDCEAALLDYELPGPGLSGSIPLRRVTNDNVPLCEALAADNGSSSQPE